MDAADAETARALAESNLEYEQRFGHIYLVCASGRTGKELLALLRGRLQNKPQESGRSCGLSCRRSMRSGCGSCWRARRERDLDPCAGHCRWPPRGRVRVRLERVPSPGRGGSRLPGSEIAAASTDPDGRVAGLGPRRHRAGNLPADLRHRPLPARQRGDSSCGTDSGSGTDSGTGTDSAAFFPEVTVTFAVLDWTRALPRSPAAEPVRLFHLPGELTWASCLGAHQYGKAETRVVRIYRDAAQHQIRDLNVSTSLRGDFADALPATATRRTCCPPTPRRTLRTRSRSNAASTEIEDLCAGAGQAFR